jgi:hypothetical protein
LNKAMPRSRFNRRTHSLRYKRRTALGTSPMDGTLRSWFSSCSSSYSLIGRHLQITQTWFPH